MSAAEQNTHNSVCHLLRQVLQEWAENIPRLSRYIPHVYFTSGVSGVEKRSVTISFISQSSDWDLGKTCKKAVSKFQSFPAMTKYSRRSRVCLSNQVSRESLKFRLFRECPVSHFDGKISTFENNAIMFRISVLSFDHWHKRQRCSSLPARHITARQQTIQNDSSVFGRVAVKEFKR